MKTKFNRILTLLIALMVQLTFAQERTISGVVSDDLGPVSDITVKVRGTDRGTVTDFDGKYSIKAKTGDVIDFTHISYSSMEKIVGASNTIDVLMNSSGVGLDEVVVTGYGGVTTQRELTTNISKANIEDVKSISTASVANALQGTVSGVQINSTSGAPGGEVSVRIRGASTINGNSNPLFIIDGITMFTGVTASNNFGGQQNSALSNLNSDDIESITILKDAASTAVYGQRGSNGVILITTKSGKKGKTKFSISSTIGFQNAINQYETMNYGEYLKYRDDYNANGGSPSGSFSSTAVGDPSLQGATPDVLSAFYNTQTNVGDNYLENVYVNNAILTNNNINVSGGNENTTYYLGVSHFFQEGTIITQDFERKNVRLNLSQKLNDNIKFTGGISLTDEFINQIVNDNNIYGVLSTGILETPGLSLFDDNGQITNNGFIFSNPLQNALEDVGNGRTFRVLGNGALNITLKNGFSLNTKAGFDQSNYIERIYNPSSAAQGANVNGYAEERHATRRLYSILQSISVNKDINENIKLRGYLGSEFENANTKLLISASEDFINTDLQGVGEGANLVIANDGTTPFTSEEKRVALISRLGFTINNNLILEGSYRADYSSKFSKDNRVGYFPGASIAYIVSSSNWFKNDFINYLKFRGSWGVTGNESPFVRYNKPTTAITQYASSNSLFLALSSEDARWEETSQIDFGFNLKILNRKLGIDYSYYTKETVGNSLVLPFPLPDSQGGASVATNVAAMTNKGHEIGINYIAFENDNFNWNFNLNFSTLDNKVTSLAGTSPIDAGFVSRVEEGQPLGYFYVLESDGLYQNINEVPADQQLNGIGPGDVKYIDQNGDGIINDDDKINAGDPWADYTINLKNNITYKKLDFSFLWSLSEGNKIFNNNLQFAGITGANIFNKFKNQTNYWTPTNTDTDIPRPNGQTRGWNNQESSRMVGDGSYIKLRNITLGYTFPKIKGIDNLRLSISADNLVLITDYDGVDPEVNAFGNTNISRGTDFLTQGSPRTMKFGINLTF